MHLKHFLFFNFSLFFTLTLTAQMASSKSIYPHNAFWNKNEFTEVLNDTIGLGIDFIHRRVSNLESSSPFEIPTRTSIRPWIHFQMGPDSRLSFSPLSLHTTRPYIASEEDYLRAKNYELRNTLQFFHHMKQMKGRLMHTWRYRLALRHRMVDGDEDYIHFARFRMRYRLRYMLNAPDFYTQGVIYAAGSAELGINFGKPVVYNNFNQNRIYLGVGFRFLNAMRLEIRYVDRIRSRGTGFEMDHDRGLMIALNIDQISYVGRRYTQPIKYAD